MGLTRASIPRFTRSNSMADITLLGGNLRRRRMVRLDSGDVPLNVAMSCESEMRTMMLLDMGVCSYTTIAIVFL